jgi:uncharacterized protein YndB with AHSA1/START domain
MAEVKEVTFERTFQAPLEKIWQAWTRPELLRQWWGPNNVTIPECEVDLRVGGRLYIVMEATEAMGEFSGTRWPAEGKYTVVEPNSKLSYTAKAWTEGDKEATTLEMLQEISFTGDGQATKVSVKVTLHKIGPKAGMAVEGMKYGFSQQFDKLAVFIK